MSVQNKLEHIHSLRAAGKSIGGTVKASVESTSAFTVV